MWFQWVWSDPSCTVQQTQHTRICTPDQGVGMIAKLVTSYHDKKKTNTLCPQTLASYTHTPIKYCAARFLGENCCDTVIFCPSWTWWLVLVSQLHPSVCPGCNGRRPVWRSLWNPHQLRFCVKGGCIDQYDLRSAAIRDSHFTRTEG